MAGGTTQYIRNCLTEILQAVYGRDVRRAIHDAIEWTVDNIEGAPIRMDELEASIEELESSFNDLKAENEALYFLNESTGTVIITGADLLMNQSVSGSKTIAQCLSQSGSDVAVGRIDETDDYILNVTIGGLV